MAPPRDEDEPAPGVDRFAAFRDPEDSNPARYKFARPFNHWAADGLIEQRFDWRDRGLVFEPRAQGGANCCTSYALSAMVEARWRLRHGQAVRLAGAYIHVCLLKVSDPLQGVNPEHAARAATSAGLAKSLVDGPPLSAAECRALADDRIGISGYGWVPPGTPMLNALVTHGPMLVEMNVPPDFPLLGAHDLYATDVDQATAKRHSMLLIGYDYPSRTAVLLNSMGRAWGNYGLLHVRFGTGGVLDHFYAMQVSIDA